MNRRCHIVSGNGPGSRGEDLISYPLRNKEDNFQYGHGSQLLLCTHIGHVIILIMP